MTQLPKLGLLLTALPFCALPFAAVAQDVDCSTAEAQNELTFCAEKDWKAADLDLNTAYKTAIADLKKIDAGLAAPDRGAEEALRASQRAWVTFRDQTCAAEGWAAHGGTAEPMLIYACRARVTAARADELTNMTAGD